MVCPICGNIIPDEDVLIFCTVCGNSIIGETAPVVYLRFSAEDRAQALAVIPDLLRAGWDVCTDDGTAPWDESKAAECRAFVFITSKELPAHPEDPALKTAMAHGKPILICLLPQPAGQPDPRVREAAGSWAKEIPVLAPEALPERLRTLLFSVSAPRPAPLPQYNYGMPPAPPPQGYGTPPGGYPFPNMNQTPTAAPAKEPKRKKDKVDFSVIADKTVKPGMSAVVDVLMYKKTQRKIVTKTLKDLKNIKEEITSSITASTVERGQAVTVLLFPKNAGVAVETESETLIWNGDPLDFKFRFQIQQEYKQKQADFECEIRFNGIHITHLYFSVQLFNGDGIPFNYVRKDLRLAFVSYSHLDKENVIRRLLDIQYVAPHLKFWMDSQCLAAGERWRAEIQRAIDKSDSFLLFWSKNAKGSAEVEKEWRYALASEKEKPQKTERIGFITPVPLESPSVCPPPSELEELHFGDPSFDSRIEGIENIQFLTHKRKYRNLRFLK